MIKGSQVGSHKGKCVSAMLWAVEGGENCDKRNVFDKRNVVVESMGCRGGVNCDKRNVFDKRNVVVESMGCRARGKL